MKRRELLKGAAAAGTTAGITGGLGSLLAGAPSTASAALPVPRPTLPQKIDPISATLRRLELVSRQATYLWTESHLNLAGVPMGTVVPPAELPALAERWRATFRRRAASRQVEDWTPRLCVPDADPA